MKMRLVLTGPESTGKSAITAHLARRFGLPSAQEYARIYLEQHGPAYDYDLLLTLSRAHKTYQLAHVPAAAPLGLLDTDLVNYRVWCEVVFGRCHPEILEAMAAEADHVYLLCFPDLPWEYDPLREHPEQRMMLFERHREAIEQLNRPYVVVKGIGEERYACAEAALRQLVQLP